MSEISSLCNEITYSKVFNEYADNLRNYLYYKTGNLNLAKDLTQEAFTNLWKHCKSVALETAKGYVFKTANNLLINEAKHQKVVLAFKKEPQSEMHKEDPAFLLEKSEFQLQLENAIAELPEKQRVVFLMSRIDKKKYQVIADELGISKKAVEKRMYIALDTLRQVSKLIR